MWFRLPRQDGSHPLNNKSNKVCYPYIKEILELLIFIGLPEAIEEIKEDHRSKPVNTLCSIDSSTNRKHLPFLPIEPLQAILKCFSYLNDLWQSDLFRNIWRSKLSKAEAVVTFADVISKIWVPVFDTCCQLIDDVKTLNIKLKDVDHYFGRVGREQGSIHHNLRNLSTAIAACRGAVADNFDWINIFVDRIMLYWSLHEQANAAATILKLKESLKLIGDFEIIESLARSSALSIAESSLKDINQKLETVSFLRRLTSDEQKLECLQKFAACSNIVEWMQDFAGGMEGWIMNNFLDDLMITELIVVCTVLVCQKLSFIVGVSGIQEFVSVALHTSAGEGALSSDKLSHLKTVATGYGPLIYDVKAMSSFEFFQSRCEAVWESMEKTSDLPELLVWYIYMIVVYSIQIRPNVTMYISSSSKLLLFFCL